MPPGRGASQAQLASDGADEPRAHGFDDAGLMNANEAMADSPSARPRRKAAQTSKAAEAADSDEEFEPAPAPPKKKRKGKTKAKADETEDEYVGESDDFEPPARTVKRSTAGKKGKGRRPKKLELFQSMPLDVLALIMSELDTKTLLAMSRTCSLFRRLLHSPQGTSIWKAARSNTSDIPDLTAGDLEEWMYASLLFDSTCHVCHKPRADVTDWTLRVRACAKCMKANSKQRDKMYGAYNAHRLVWECVPESKWSPGYFGDAVYTFYWLPTVQAVSKRLKELDGKSGFDDYVKARKRIRQAATVDGIKITRWWSSWKAAKNTQAWVAQVGRKEKVNAKLAEMGYTKSELDRSAIQRHSLMQQSRDLTDRIWKTVCPKFVAILEEERAARRARELAAAMKGHADALKPFYDSLQSSIPSAESRALFPPFGNFLMFDSVKGLYEPEDADQTPTALAAARNSIMDDANRFAAEIKSAFFSQLVKAHNEAGTEHPSDDSGTTTLSQADVEQLAERVDSAVKCPSSWCTTYMTFPAVLDHYKVCGHQPLTAESLSTSAARILATKHVIASVTAVEPGRFKKDSPSSTTLYALGTAFECDDCKSREGAIGPAGWSGKYQSSARWSGMVQHILDKHAQSALALPHIEYTPPAPPSPGQDNPGGFVVEDDA